MLFSVERTIFCLIYRLINSWNNRKKWTVCVLAMWLLLHELTYISISVTSALLHRWPSVCSSTFCCILMSPAVKKKPPKSMKDVQDKVKYKCGERRVTVCFDFVTSTAIYWEFKYQHVYWTWDAFWCLVGLVFSVSNLMKTHPRFKTGTNLLMVKLYWFSSSITWCLTNQQDKRKLTILLCLMKFKKKMQQHSPFVTYK